MTAIAGKAPDGSVGPEVTADETDAIQRIDKTTGTIHSISLALLSGCAYAWLAVGQTTDTALVLNGDTSDALPLIGSKVPLYWLYSALPAVLTAIGVYLLIYLDNLWQALGELTTNAETAVRRITPSPVVSSGMAIRHGLNIFGRSRWIVALEMGLSAGITFLLGPLTIIAMWGRTLRLHDWMLTAAILLPLAALMLAYPTFCGAALKHLKEACRPIVVNLGRVLALVILALLLWASYDLFKNDGEPLASIGIRNRLDLGSEAFRPKPSDWEQDKEKAAKTLKELNLAGIDLRKAHAPRLFLASANLQHADLRGATLIDASFYGSDLSYADFDGANLTGADLSKAILRCTKIDSKFVPSGTANITDNCH
jgi:hypothetical protein